MGINIAMLLYTWAQEATQKKEAIRMKKKNAFMMYALSLLMNKSTPFPYN